MARSSLVCVARETGVAVGPGVGVAVGSGVGVVVGCDVGVGVADGVGVGVGIGVGVGVEVGAVVGLGVAVGSDWPHAANSNRLSAKSEARRKAVFTLAIIGLSRVTANRRRRVLGETSFRVLSC